jgi:hypothetical protein
MRNAPNKRFRPTELDFGDGRPERGGRGDRGGRGNLTSVTRAPRDEMSLIEPLSGNVNTPVSRGTTSGAPVSRVQTGTSRAPAAKPAVTSAIKKPAVAAKTTTKAPVAAKTTTTKAPVAAKTTTPKTPVAAKTTTTKPVSTIAKPAVTTTKTTTKPSSNLTSTLKKAAVAAGTAALVNNAIKKIAPTSPKPPVSPVVKPPVTTPKPPVSQPPVSPKPPVVKPPVSPKPPVVKPPVTPPVVKPPITSVVKPTGIPTKGGVGIKPGGGAPTLKPPTGGTKTPVVPKGSTAGVTAALTEDQIQAELDRVRTETEGNVVPEGAVTNEDGSYSVTENGMINTYDKDGNIIGMEAVTDTTVGGDGEDTVVAGDGTDTTSGLTRSLTGGTGDTTVTGEDTSGMTDLGEGYFQDDSGNIYGADGNLMYTVGEDGEYVDASAVDDTSTATYDETTYTDPETGDVYNLGEDGNWTLEGGDSFTEDATTYTDPETGFTWNQGADGEWTQEGFEGSSDDTFEVDDTVIDDGSSDDTYVADDEYVDDGTNYEEDAKGGSIVKKYKRNARRFDDGGYTGYGEDFGYSDTGEEVQDFQNVGYNYGEFDDPSMTGDQSLYSQSQPYQNTYLRSAMLDAGDDGYIPSPEGWPDGFIDNGDGTATYVDDDGSTMTIDADTNIVFTTDADGNVFSPEVGESVSGTYPDETGESVSGTYPYETGESVSGNYPVEGITSSGSGNKPSFLAQQERDESVSGRYDQPDQSGILDSLLNAVRDNPGLAGGAVGALIASLMDQAGESESASPSQPVDISELTSFDPRTTDFGAGMVGGRTGTGSPIVSYADYAEDGGDEIIDDRLYSDLGISGYLREPDMNNYRDEEGNLTDQSGNLVDEYGYLLEDGSGEYEETLPEEETAVEDAYEAEEEPAMAGGGSTHYTFGRVINPADNLGLGQGMKKGGLSQAHTVHSHHANPVVNSRVDFRKGSAVNGAGDGQSDDIPAWLADGEYVMDAELVSMLGNGSNKAGAKVLDKFRENIRAHKRGAPLGKIPPKAKSPLNYLKEAMNG